MKFNIINLLLLGAIIQSCTVYHNQSVSIEEAIFDSSDYVKILDNNGLESIFYKPFLKDSLYYGIDGSLPRKVTVRKSIEEYELNSSKRLRVFNSVGQKFKFKRIHFSDGKYYGILKKDTTELLNVKDQVEYQILNDRTRKIPIEESTFLTPLKFIDAEDQKIKFNKIYHKNGNYYGILKNDAIQISDGIVYKWNRRRSRNLTKIAISGTLVLAVPVTVVLMVLFNIFTY